jgi:hypothetical protein
MKTKAKEIAKNHGCAVSYSGALRTMFISGPNAKAAIAEINALKPVFDVKEAKPYVKVKQPAE